MNGHTEDELIPYPDSVTMHQGRDAVGLRHTGTDVWIIPLRPRPRGALGGGGDAMTKCESCNGPYEGGRGGCQYCLACCTRWHVEEIGHGVTIHSAEAGQTGR